MSERWAGLRSDIWLVVVIAVGLMSGIASLAREWLSIFFPHAVNTGQLFYAFLSTCFFLAFLLVFYRQRSTIESLKEKLDENRTAKEKVQKLRAEFGNYMDEVERLTREWRNGMREYGAWLQRRQDWVQRVSDFLTSIGFPDEAAAFRHAGEEGDDDVSQPQGVSHGVYLHRLYGGQTDRWRTKLAEIARRLN